MASPGERRTRSAARLTSPVRRRTVFRKVRLGVCAMQDLEQKLKRLFQTAWKLQPGPVRKSDIQRTRAVPASDKCFAKRSRVTGTQRRIGLNAPEGPAPLFPAHRIRLAGNAVLLGDVLQCVSPEMAETDSRPDRRKVLPAGRGDMAGARPDFRAQGAS